MKQRYCHRLYPHPHQQVALAKAFGCSRVVWNDALAKKTPQRTWLSGASNVVLQQSLCDLDQAFPNCWSSLKGKTQGTEAQCALFAHPCLSQAFSEEGHCGCHQEWNS